MFKKKGIKPFSEGAEMLERFAIIDPEVRDNFEKLYQIPYGYGSVKIFTDREDAISTFKKIPKDHRETLRLERITDYAREYLIV